MAMPAGQTERWMAQTSHVKDLIALDQRDRAAAEIAAASADPGAGVAERLHWMGMHIAYLRLLKGRPGQLAESQALVAAARRDGSPTMVADALLLASESYTFTGAQEQSIAALQEAERLYSGEGDREGRARAMLTLGQRIQVHGRNGDAIAILSDAMREVSGAGFFAVEQQIEQLLGQAYGRGYDPELSRQMLSRALVLSWSQPDQYATRQVLQRLGITLTEEGNLTEARKLLQAALPARIERGEAAARTFNARGEADLLAGDVKAALADAAQAASLGAGAPDVVSDALILRTRALALKGDYSALEAEFSKAVDLASRRGMPGSRAHEQEQWGECLLESGSAKAAVSHLRAAENLFRQIDRPADQAAASALLATALVRLGDVSGAKASVVRAGTIASVYKFAHPRILLELAQAQVAAAQGHRDEARRLYQLARDDAARVQFAPQAKAAEVALLELEKPGS
jgi:tetratricopeptide (TPR) repeat protein